MSWPLKGGSIRTTISSAGSGLGAVLSPVVPDGFRFTGTQWYRNGVAIASGSGGNGATYTKVAADIPATGSPDITITVELTGLTLMSLGDTSSSPAIQAATLRQVATGTHIPNILAASNTTTYSRTPHILMSAVSSLAIVLPNWYVAGQTETNAGSATWTASVEYPAGTFARITFGGAASVTSASGGNIVSDQMSVAIPKGEKFWVRLFQNAPSKAVYFNYYAGDGTAQFTSPATDMTMGGNVTVCPAFQSAVTAPIAIIGMSSDPAIGIYGDSISVGRGDTADAGLPLQGHLGRAFGASYAAGHVGVSGDRMSLFLGSKAKRMSLANYFTHFALNMGINDITGGSSSATVASNTDAIVALFPGPVALCTLSPVSSSTASWNTTASQTTVASNSVRVTENTRRLAGTSGVKTVIDANAIVEASNGIWKAPAYTTDGTHPAVVGYKAEATAINVAALVS
jgi:lysophospholipase L1-like esterase